jgi:glutaconyl-CoA/methylmalonyl-CoA decarboxylase subunit delta
MMNLMIPAKIVFDFGLIDDFAIVLSIVGYLVVFSALIALYFVFYNLPRLLSLDFKKYLRKQKMTVTEKPAQEVTITGEVNAAISTALFLYFSELHDEESNVITIKKISRRYSPWSSKIYGLRHTPRG